MLIFHYRSDTYQHCLVIFSKSKQISSDCFFCLIQSQSVSGLLFDQMMKRRKFPHRKICSFVQKDKPKRLIDDKNR